MILESVKISPVLYDAYIFNIEYCPVTPTRPPT